MKAIAQTRPLGEQKPESYIKNCLISMKESDHILFDVTAGETRYYLDGYAIIPMDEYNRIKALEPTK